jgi:hypothetical protein
MNDEKRTADVASPSGLVAHSWLMRRLSSIGAAPILRYNETWNHATAGGGISN